jgi:hypothetical protein
MCCSGTTRSIRLLLHFGDISNSGDETWEMRRKIGENSVHNIFNDTNGAHFEPCIQNSLSSCQILGSCHFFPWRMYCNCQLGRISHHTLFSVYERICSRWNKYLTKYIPSSFSDAAWFLFSFPAFTDVPIFSTNFKHKKTVMHQLFISGSVWRNGQFWKSLRKRCFHFADTCKGRRIVVMYLRLSYARKLTSQAAVVCVWVCMLLACHWWRRWPDSGWVWPQVTPLIPYRVIRKDVALFWGSYARLVQSDIQGL